MPPTIIGIGHKARQGKDTFAQAIIAHYGHSVNVQRFAFADALKSEVNHFLAMFGGNWEHLFDATRDVWGTDRPHYVEFDPRAPMDDPLCPYGKQRTFLQWWGELRREQDPLFWVRRVASKIEKVGCEYAVITDMRFRNEHDWVQAQHGVTIRVERIGAPPIANSGHASETDLDGVAMDYQVRSTSLDEATASAVSIFRKILEGQHANRNRAHHHGVSTATEQS